MGKIKKILENELVGGTQTTDVYPVTSVKAVYDENNERLDHILNRRGVVNISTNYNADHTAEVLTLSQAIAKVPSSDRVIGFQGKYLASDGWHTIIYTSDNLPNWGDETKWIDLADKLFNSISNNATFAGVAAPSTNPGVPDGPVFYIATQAGTYSNFNGIEVSKGESAILKWDNGTWAKNTFKPMTDFDSVFDANGKSLTEFESGIIYDVSTHNDGAVFKSLQALLSSPNLSTLIPTSVRHGGMSIRFIQSSNNKYVQYRLITDKWSTNIENWSFCGNDVYVDNPEFIRAVLDNEGKILWAIKTDGSIYWGAGVPQQVIDYVAGKIEELSLDEYEDIVTFLGNLITGDKTLQELLDEKVDTVEGKSLVDAEYANGVSHIENPEWIDVKTDNDDKVLEGTEKDGTKLFTGNVKILGNMDVACAEYSVVSNPEYIAAWIDSSNKVIFGFKVDGKTFVGDADFLDYIDEIKNVLTNIIPYTDIDWDALKSIKATENPEYINVELDSNSKILGGRKTDGTKFENVALDLGGNTLKSIEDVEERHEITLDEQSKVISYRKNDGTKVENIGLETPSLSSDKINIPKSEAQRLVHNGIVYDKNLITEDPLNLPNYGSLNFVTQDIPFQYQDDVVMSVYIESVSELECTNVGYVQFGVGNSTISWFDEKYYIAKTQVGTTVQINAPKQVYSPAKALAVKFVACVDGLNVTEDTSITYTNIIFKRDAEILATVPTYTLNIRRVDGVYKESYYGYSYTENGMFGYIESLGKWLVWNWAKDKSIEHYGQIEIDIPGYIEGTEYASIKLQGNSTINDLKKSFRLTLYKASDYAKKKKVKIGDMIRLSGFNLKSFSNRPVRFNEPLAYRMVHMIWRSRSYLDQYPWNNTHVIYTSATGSIKQFPIKLEINSKFYGLNFMGEKKDEDNYMLDGTDQSGMFLSLGSNNSQTFSDLNTFLSGWEDEMIDEDDSYTPWVNTTNRRTTDSNIAALTNWFNYFNGQNFNENTAETYFSKIDWIDYMIFVQVFCLGDNLANNLLVYTDSAKTKFYPYVYDLDQALDNVFPNGDVFDTSSYDTSLYQKLNTIWWEDIVARYWELREGCLSVPVFTKIANKLCSSVAYSDFEDETGNWNLSDTKKIKNIINNFSTRLSFCDSFYK